jgi:iron-sulfur cluster assembly protein/iron-sulfur cluster insertion protein
VLRWAWGKGTDPADVPVCGGAPELSAPALCHPAVDGRLMLADICSRHSGMVYRPEVVTISTGRTRVSMSQILSIKSNKPIKTVTLTDTAVSKVGELIAAEGEEALALRMAVRPGGCSGFSYEMFFDAEIEAADIVEEFGDVKVVVDPQSAERLRGSTLDYRDGLMGAGFAIDNPNVTKSCGCGNSFS